MNWYMCKKINRLFFLNMCLTKGDEVVWVGLVIVEHNKHGGVVDIIHQAVVAVIGLLAVARRRHPHVVTAQSEKACQDSGHEHGLSTVCCGIGVAH